MAKRFDRYRVEVQQVVTPDIEHPKFMGVHSKKRQPAALGAITMSSDWQEGPFDITRLSTFRKCRKRFFYKYVEQRRGAFEPVELFLGRIVHDCLAWLYSAKARRRKVLKEDLLIVFEEKWKKSVASAVKLIRPGDSFAKQRSRGTKMLGRFFERRFQSDSTRTLEIERYFRLRLKRKYDFQGRIDRVAVDEAGNICVIDYKTSRLGAHSVDFDDDLDLQLDAYGLWALLYKKAERVQLTLEFLADGTSNTIDLKWADGNTVTNELVARIEEVLEESTFPARSSPLCKWCGYEGICPGR